MAGQFWVFEEIFQLGQVAPPRRGLGRGDAEMGAVPVKVTSKLGRSPAIHCIRLGCGAQMLQLASHPAGSVVA
jgi:hypothetical protein